MLTRRAILALPLALAVRPLRAAAAAVGVGRRSAYAADVGILYNALDFHVEGTIAESVDHVAGRYLVTIDGEGPRIENRVDAHGVLRDGRWVPTETRSRFVVHGRESRVHITYDHDARRIAFRARSETFVLRRVRVVDDVVAIPGGLRVDDVISASLNYAERRWPSEPDGTLRTHVTRRRRDRAAGADDGHETSGAELVPFVLRVASDPDSGRPAAFIDLSSFSSWALEDRPARILFGPDRRPEAITSSLMLGTSLDIRIAG